MVKVVVSHFCNQLIRHHCMTIMRVCHDSRDTCATPNQTMLYVADFIVPSLPHFFPLKYVWHLLSNAIGHPNTSGSMTNGALLLHGPDCTFCTLTWRYVRDEAWTLWSTLYEW